MQQLLHQDRRSVEVLLPDMSSAELLDDITRIGATDATHEPEITVLGSVYPMVRVGIVKVTVV